MKNKLKQHIQPFTDLERLLFLRKYLNQAISDLKRKDKAAKAELDYGFNIIGLRGGKFTSLNAHSQRCTKSYLESIEMMKIVAEII